MSTTTETQRLYYGFSKDELAYPSRIDRDRWDNYVITIRNLITIYSHTLNITIRILSITILNSNTNL